MKLMNVVKVGIADMKIAKAPGILRTIGLGSCVGVVIYDAGQKVAGLAHIMLPDSTVSRNKDFNPFKYADTAIDLLVEDLVTLGARKFAMKAKIAGGAQMFSFPGTDDMLRIGTRNVEAVLASLSSHRIPVTVKEVGGNNGRTIEFDTETTILKIRTVNAGESEI
ncbi:chemotaxis protein CheD [Sediminibacillus massiliensis]|uniref:chemotaxis protein CheD n=1 Tax=Sediminibacillus massiliensis TaxID=1926277 RepID=UPI000BAE645D|nr:chemotaxis protein CheD [Sediminibacillus massiliensis]